jgi:hypothetical protein
MGTFAELVLERDRVTEVMGRCRSANGPSYPGFLQSNSSTLKAEYVAAFGKLPTPNEDVKADWPTDVPKLCCQVGLAR